MAKTWTYDEMADILYRLGAMEDSTDPVREMCNYIPESVLTEISDAFMEYSVRAIFEGLSQGDSAVMTITALMLTTFNMGFCVGKETFDA